ncbi:phasin family protein [Micromonospora sp. NPDC003197]
MQDAWRAYLELALGLTEASRKRAQTVARRLVGSSGATAAQLQALAEELVSTGLANREALTKIIRFEVDRALGAVGLATADEVAELTNRVRQLESELQEAKTTASTAASATGEMTAATSAGTLTAGTAGAAAASAPAKQVAAKKTAAKSAVAKKAVVKKVAAKQVAKKAVAKKTVAKKTTATQVAAKKTGPPPATKSNSTRKLPPGTGAA